MPKQKGSPEASTVTGLPRLAMIAGMASVMGLGQAMRSAAEERPGERQVPLAAENAGCLSNGRAGGRAQPLDTILADADNRQPWDTAHHCGC